MTTPATPAAPVAGGRGRGRGRGGDPNASDPNDWRHDSPGKSYRIPADSLAEPYATPAAGNFPQVAPQPPDAKLEVPPGFKVELFAKGFTNPRIVHVAPNGDIFIAETSANRIHLLRAPDGAAVPTADEIFATGLNRPFGDCVLPKRRRAGVGLCREQQFRRAVSLSQRRPESPRSGGDYSAAVVPDQWRAYHTRHCLFQGRTAPLHLGRLFRQSPGGTSGEIAGRDRAMGNGECPGCGMGRGYAPCQCYS